MCWCIFDQNVTGTVPFFDAYIRRASFLHEEYFSSRAWLSRVGKFIAGRARSGRGEPARPASAENLLTRSCPPFHNGCCMDPLLLEMMDLRRGSTAVRRMNDQTNKGAKRQHPPLRKALGDLLGLTRHTCRASPEQSNTAVVAYESLPESWRCFPLHCVLSSC